MQTLILGNPVTGYYIESSESETRQVWFFSLILQRKLLVAKNNNIILTNTFTKTFINAYYTMFNLRNIISVYNPVKNSFQNLTSCSFRETDFSDWTTSTVSLSETYRLNVSKAFYYITSLIFSTVDH